MTAVQGQDMMTPTMSGPLATPVSLTSPSTRKKPNITSPFTSGVPSLLVQQDDANERKERRRSRLLEMQRHNLNSPATPTDKRKSISTPGGLSNGDLANHYANCIKLSAENKINAKNAFGLHLIDYLSELLKKKEMNNFQVASSTLDASAKIYAGRVDAIHSETYKVLTGLGRSSDRQEEGSREDADGDPGENDTRDGSKNKRRRVRKKATVETNLKNINVKKVDMEFEVDPLFQKTAAMFDEGGSGGLLLNHLGCLDDTSSVAVDLNTAVMSGKKVTSQRHPTDLTELRELYSGMALENLQICPEFSEFSFTNWNRDAEETANATMTARMSKDVDRRFDVDGVIEQQEVPEEEDADMDMPFDDFTGNDDDAPNSQENDTMIERLASGSTVITLTNNKEAELVDSAMHEVTHGSVGSLIQSLASEPSEYSYFTTNIEQSWAGPEHWKLKAKSREEKIADKDGTKEVKKSRKRKEPFTLSAEDGDEAVVEKAFKETQAATTLTRRTLTKNSMTSTLLPEHLQYEARDLLHLAIKNKILVRRQDASTLEDVDDGVENYDYNNDNDKENFVPDLQCCDDDDADVDGDVGHTMGFDMSAGDVFTQQSTQADPNTTVFKGDNLVQQPHKVAKIDIGYAKTAKKVDVKRLKHSMWTMLCTEPKAAEEENAESQETEKIAEETTTDKTKVAGEHKFSELVKDLPNHVSKTMAKNLSVPIAFVCLLHLANEKTLKIEGDSEMSDLRITQGLKQLLSM